MFCSTHFIFFNNLSTNITKWSNTLKQFVGNFPTNCLSVFDHFVGLALTGLKKRKLIEHFHLTFNRSYKQLKFIDKVFIHPNSTLTILKLPRTKILVSKFKVKKALLKFMRKNNRAFHDWRPLKQRNKWNQKF